MIPSLRVGVFLLLWIETLLVSSVKVPPDMTQGIFCESCSAMMKELDKLLQKKTSDPREVQVVEAMEDICQAKYFSMFDYSPPTSVKACKFLMEHYEEEIEAMLFRKEETEAEQKVCYELTKACEGIDRSKKEKENMDVRFNNEPQKLNTGEAPKEEDDGINRMNIDINDPKSAERLAEQIKQQIGGQQFGGQDEGDEDEDDDEEEDYDDDNDESDEEKEQKTEL